MVIVSVATAWDFVRISQLLNSGVLVTQSKVVGLIERVKLVEQTQKLLQFDPESHFSKSSLTPFLQARAIVNNE
jgi:hypothetical protein